MKFLNIEVFDKLYKRMYLILFMAILFLIGSSLFIYFGYKKEHEVINYDKDMYELISNNYTKENFPSYIEVNSIPVLFGYYKTDDEEENAGFYFVEDKNQNSYIVYMEKSLFEEMNNEEIYEKPITITGKTSLITEDIKNIAIDTLLENESEYDEAIEEQEVTKENFKERYGSIYLDTVTPIYNTIPYYIGTSFSLMLSIVLFIIYFVKLYTLKKTTKKYSKEELQKIAAEIYAIKENDYKSMNLYLTKNYVVDLSLKIVILKYEDIIWAYPRTSYALGLVVNRAIRVYTLNDGMFDIANTNYGNKITDEILDKIIEELKTKNKQLIIGDNKENKEIIKERMKQNKAKKRFERKNN